MKREKALRLAIKALEAQQKIYNVDANIYELLKEHNPEFAKAYKSRSELREAVTVIKEMLEDK